VNCLLDVPVCFTLGVILCCGDRAPTLHQPSLSSCLFLLHLLGWEQEGTESRQVELMSLLYGDRSMTAPWVLHHWPSTQAICCSCHLSCLSTSVPDPFPEVLWVSFHICAIAGIQS
jgi:hypothetical protein